MKNEAIEDALWARQFAILLPNHTTTVGASIYTTYMTFHGFNIQNRCHKSYHAEELAVLHCILMNVNPDDILGIVITFSKNDIKRLTFACGHCRQYLWEFTENPDLLVTEVDIKGNIIKEVKLGYLYPYPYPR